jgi:hypothetical protein
MNPTCPNCSKPLEDATGDWQCHACRMLWPASFLGGKESDAFTKAFGDLGAEVNRLRAERDAYRAVLEGIDRWLTIVMNESNLHVFEPIAGHVTAALAGGKGASE